MHWTSQTKCWQTNDRGHRGPGETWGGTILLLPWGVLILRGGGGYELKTIKRCRVAWGKLNELRPVITSRSFPITSRGRDFNPCVRSAMLAKSGPQPYPNYIVYNVTTKLWFAECIVSPPRTKSACRISWRWCSLTIWQRHTTLTDSDGTAMYM